jgi:Dolichyl-phosphate-mannose-protein mannosyltransferase
MTQEYIESLGPAQRPRRLLPAQVAFRVAPVALVVVVLAAASLALLVALRAPRAWSLDVGAPGDTRFVSEMLDRERDSATGITFRWTEPLALLWLHGTEFGSFALNLHIYNQAALAGSRELQLTRGDRVLGSLRLAEGWRVYRVLLPGSAGDSGLGTPPLELATTPIHTPGDSLERGVPLDWAHVYPLARAAPPWRALLLAWGLVALAGWLWQLDRALLVRDAATRDLRVAALVAVVAAGLVAWALADPHALALAIPPTPWTFGLATVLLVASGLAPLRARMQWRQLALAAVALLVAGQALLVTQAAVALGVGLVLLSLALLPDTNRRTAEPQNQKSGVRSQGLLHDLRSSPTHPLTRSPAHLLIALALLFLIALGLRFYRLGELPYGLWRDEGRHGLVALQMLADPSYRPAYIPGGVDLPGLGMYPFALALHIWGIHVWTMRTVTALAGALAILPLYALTRRLYGPRIALLAAALLAFSHWDVTISRFSFPTIYDPLLQLTALWLLMLGLDRLTTDHRPPTTDWHRTEDQEPRTAEPQNCRIAEPRNRELADPRPPIADYRLGTGDWRLETGDYEPETIRNTPQVSGLRSRVSGLVSLFFSGVCLGLAAQTYHTGRLGLVIAGLLALLLLLRMPGRWRRWLVGVGVLGIGFVLAASPLLHYALDNPGAFNQRVGAVFLLSDESTDKRAPLTKLDDSIGRHLLMFNVRGDSNGRHVAPNQPMLDAVTGLGLLAGGAAAPRRRRDWRSLFLLGALAIGLLPSVLAVDSPHGMRSIDTLPFACVIAALGLAELWQLLSWGLSRDSEPPRGRRAAVMRAAAGLAVCLALALNAWTYFGIMPADRLVWTSFYPYHTRIGAYIRALADDQGPEAARQVYVPAQLVDNPVFQYLTYELPVQTFDARRLSAPAPLGALFVLPSTIKPQDLRVLVEQNGLGPAPVASGPLLPDGATPSFVVYRKQ